MSGSPRPSQKEKLVHGLSVKDTDFFKVKDAQGGSLRPAGAPRGAPKEPQGGI